MPSKFSFAIDCDNYYKFTLTNPDGTAKSGLADVTVSVSASDGGAPIGTLTKYAAAETATPGTYAATFAEADLASQLGTALVGTTVYVVIYEGSKVLGSDPCSVTAAARVG